MEVDTIDESSQDAGGFNLKPTNTSKPIYPNDGSVKFDPDAMYYDMSGGKYLIILNHHTYKRTRYFNEKQPSTRHGTDQDVKSLTALFEDRLGFTVTAYKDLIYEDIIKALTYEVCKDHSDTSCMCVAILTHGDRGGTLMAADMSYKLSDITNIFEKQPNLVNKPKLFFIQACRGDNVDAGNKVVLDSVSENTLIVPTHSDFLILYSTVEDYLSYRDVNGSWMIQTLCEVFSSYYDSMELLQMITLIHRRVAYERLTNTADRRMHEKKQMPETQFTLTKLLKFRKFTSV